MTRGHDDPRIRGDPAGWRSKARSLCFAAVTALLCYAVVVGPDLLALDEAGRALWFGVAWLAAPSVAAVACLQASWRSRGTDRLAWRYFGLGCALWASGTLIWYLTGTTFPSLADAAYILTTILVGPGMYHYGIAGRQVNRVQLLNFCLFLGAINVSAFYFLADEMQGSDLTLAGTLIAFLYPVAWLGTAAFGAMCMLLYAPRYKMLPFTLLILGVLLQGVADLFYALDLMGAGYGVGSAYDVVWVLCFLMITWSAAEHSAAGAPLPRAAAPSRAQCTAEAFVPAAALSLVGIAGAVPGVAVYGNLFLFSVPAVILLAAILGLREHWILAKERDLRRAAARTSEELMKVLEATNDSVAVIGRDWRITYLNNRARRMFEHIPGFSVGSVLWDIFPSEDHARFRRHYDRAFDTQQAFEIEEYLVSEGIWLQVHIAPCPDSLSLFFRDVTDHKCAVAKLEHLANHDPLTGLSNRRTFQKRLEAALAAPSDHQPTVVLFLDLDHFKEVNDTDGHAVGDALLVEVGKRIQSCCAGEEMEVARTGGDEFAILLTGRPAEARAGTLSRSLIEALAKPFDIEGRSLQVGVSIGSATSRDRETAGQILARADIALYEAKSAGRSNHRAFSPDMEARLRRQHELRSLLPNAIANAEFIPFYQPVIDLRTSGVIAVEALLRWRHPELGFVPPAEFVPIAEDAGLIHSIGEWMLRRVCNDAAKWPEEICVAVNLSPTEIRNRHLPAQVASILAETGLSASRLEIEITESVLLQDTDSNLWTMDQLRELGVSIALDDFGVGYSSLGYLRRFPVEKIKLDRSFVEAIDNDGQARAVMSAVIALGRSLGMTITAEGIETVQQLESVRRNGCDQGQGYLFSPPVPGSELPALLDRLEDLRTSPDLRQSV